MLTYEDSALIFKEIEYSIKRLVMLVYLFRWDEWREAWTATDLYANEYSLPEKAIVYLGQIPVADLRGEPFKHRLAPPLMPKNTAEKKHKNPLKQFLGIIFSFFWEDNYWYLYWKICDQISIWLRYLVKWVVF